MLPDNKTYRISIGKQYFLSTLALFIFITILYNLQVYIGYETVSLILLLIIFPLPLFNFEKGPIILSAVICALAWDYYFIPPHFTMHIDRTEDGVMLFMFFIVALTNGILTTRLKEQKNIIIKKEIKFNRLYKLLKGLSEAKSPEELAGNIVEQIDKAFGLGSVIFIPANKDTLNREPLAGKDFAADEMEWLAAQECFNIKEETGKSTPTLSTAEGIYIPISGYCVIGVKISDELKTDKEKKEFLRGFLKETEPYFERFFGGSK